MQQQSSLCLSARFRQDKRSIVCNSHVCFDRLPCFMPICNSLTVYFMFKSFFNLGIEDCWQLSFGGNDWSYNYVHLWGLMMFHSDHVCWTLFVGCSKGMPGFEFGRLQTSPNRCLEWTSTSHSGFYLYIRLSLFQ
jgi:hypothetical protein